MPLKLITNFLGGINANKRPGEIAAGIAFGFLLAAQPGWTIAAIVFFCIAFMLKINMPALFLSLFLFSLASPVLDIPSGLLGGFILNLPALRGFFTVLYNLPLVPYTRFNDTLVMGGLALGIIAWLPLFFAFRVLVGIYRNTVREKIVTSNFFKAFMKLPLVSKIFQLVGKILDFSAG
ncbi:MAG: TIGR03546 family protein [Spirochaetales bacterium]|jgi:uncharacterized protein (TIGR03546 family)|nr:TIGR03546 family protein [Spirochaetales bacterium]